MSSPPLSLLFLLSSCDGQAEPPEKEFMVCALDLLSGMSEGLGEGFESLLASSNLLQLLLQVQYIVFFFHTVRRVAWGVGMSCMLTSPVEFFFVLFFLWLLSFGIFLLLLHTVRSKKQMACDFCWGRIYNRQSWTTKSCLCFIDSNA